MRRALPMLLLVLAGCGGDGGGDGPGEARQACRRQLELTTELRLGLVSIGRTEVDGDSATVRAVIDAGGVQAPRLFRLEREDGRWKLASGSSG